jgi:hypothetical protein
MEPMDKPVKLAKMKQELMILRLDPATTMDLFVLVKQLTHGVRVLKFVFQLVQTVMNIQLTGLKELLVPSSVTHATPPA